MLLSPDAFIHVPMLFGKIVEPEKSTFRVSLATSPRYADLSGAEAAAIIATGRGVLGTNLEYFDNLADHVAVLGIEDEVFEAIRSQLHRRG